jgi:hypothetical protein
MRRLTYDRERRPEQSLRVRPGDLVTYDLLEMPSAAPQHAVGLVIWARESCVHCSDVGILFSETNPSV